MALFLSLLLIVWTLASMVLLPRGPQGRLRPMRLLKRHTRPYGSRD